MDSITQQERAQLEEVFAAICESRERKMGRFYLGILKNFLTRTKNIAAKTNYKMINSVRIIEKSKRKF
jgi:hypothetical protein